MLPQQKTAGRPLIVHASPFRVSQRDAFNSPPIRATAAAAAVAAAVAVAVAVAEPAIGSDRRRRCCTERDEQVPSARA